MPIKTYDARLACCNCGFKTFYKLPYGSEFMPFRDVDETITGERALSHIHLGGLEEEPGQAVDKNCKNCGLPFLVIEWWDMKDVPKDDFAMIAQFSQQKDEE